MVADLHRVDTDLHLLGADLHHLVADLHHLDTLIPYSRTGGRVELKCNKAG
jgi:hypothetical protein